MGVSDFEGQPITLVYSIFRIQSIDGYVRPNMALIAIKMSSNELLSVIPFKGHTTSGVATYSGRLLDRHRKSYQKIVA